VRFAGRRASAVRWVRLGRDFGGGGGGRGRAEGRELPLREVGNGRGQISIVELLSHPNR
jgi:hypothetical protein